MCSKLTFRVYILQGPISPPDTPASRPFSLGERIRQARQELSLSTRSKVSQEQLGVLVAKQLGKAQPIAGATVSRWEADSAAPDLATLEAIAAVCKVDRGWLVVGAERQIPQHEGPVSKAVREAHDTLTGQKTAALLFERQAQLVRRALERTLEWKEDIVRELRLRMEEDTPQARRRCKEILRELDGPTPLEILARDLFMSEEDADRARRRDRKREMRYEEEDLEEEEGDD